MCIAYTFTYMTKFSEIFAKLYDFLLNYIRFGFSLQKWIDFAHILCIAKLLNLFCDHSR